VPQRDVHPEVVGRITGNARFEADRETLDLGRPANLVHVGAGDALEPHRLPDAGGARIPDRVRLALPILLAARLGDVVGIILREHRHRLPARRIEHAGDVGPERRVPAFVHHRELVVDPHPGREVDGTEAQDDPGHRGADIRIRAGTSRRSGNPGRRCRWLVFPVRTER
jgi:hypothetical protein